MPATINPAPTAVDEILDPAWLSASLDLPVRAVEVVETIKTVATKVRLRIDLDDALPSQSLCVKGFFDHDPLPANRARSTQNEVRFYREIAPRLDIVVPHARYARIDEASGHGLLIMDDVVARGGRFLSALEPYSPEQARDSLAALATLHAAHWHESGLDDVPWVGDWLQSLADTPLMPATDLQLLMDDGRFATHPGLADAERLHHGIRALAERGRGDVRTLVHGDAHAGNLYTIDGRMALIDWQVLQRSTWAIDVAYHVGAALSVEQRRSHERALLESYLDALRARGVDAPPATTAWDSYRAGMIYGYYLWAVTRRVARPITEEFSQRLVTAVDDLDSYALLGV
ncbi:oxidoreductase family protein [Microbacterium sp. No. 7]|uniref:oxidoreductase family protein n=1 Tax=Microbacterium sp. No. 7 TaxID=1714373 RepID=UPI0006CF87FA|nr:oxidoreductase family protein [Microbacterium sp. No. 7]ALJ18820.1 hypothetical protein AOA12_02380 [Microbacterium sp. No. 7]